MTVPDLDNGATASTSTSTSHRHPHPPPATGIPFTPAEVKWLPVILSLAGGLIVGSMFAVASWTLAADGQTSYAVAFGLSALACSLLPLTIVKLALSWADRPAVPQAPSKGETR